jgi:hypothetical protein
MITKYEQFIDMLRSRLSRPSLPFAEIIQMVANKNLNPLLPTFYAAPFQVIRLSYVKGKKKKRPKPLLLIHTQSWLVHI